MIKHTCLDCKHYCYKNTVHDGFEKISQHIYAPKERTIEHHCKTHPEVFKKWWEENAHKTRDEITEVPTCLELTDFIAHLDNMNKLAQSILDNLNKR